MRSRHLTFALPLLAVAAASIAQAPPKLADYYTLIAPKVIDASYEPLWISLVFSADLNGDGHQDLIITAADFTISGMYNVPQPGRVLFGDGNGKFSIPEAGVFPIESFNMVDPRKVVFGDLNGDGRLDMFVACHGWDTDPYPGEQNRLYLSNPAGGWTDATSTLPQLNDYTHSAALGDLSGRGVLDIIAGNFFGGQNQISSYALVNDGSGRFSMTRANIPAGPGEAMDATSGHWFLGTTLADLNGDGLPELILSSTGVGPYSKLTHTTILWNHGGAFANNSKTEVPYPSPFFETHIDLDAQPIDFDGDGLPDLVVVGSQSVPPYDGWFVQLLRNQGDGMFVDVTASYLDPSDTFAGTPNVPTGTTWPVWVKVLDFNGDGLPDFAVEYYFPTGPPTSGDSPGKALPANTPLIYLNDGKGHFSTLKVHDFVAPGDEWKVGYGHLMQTQNGYSFITPYLTPKKDGLHLTGLLATKPYRPPVRTVEYYNASLDHYFITWVAAEQANLDAGKTPTKWTRTGYSFNAFSVPQAGTSPVCRYYIPPAKGDSHFFGRGTAECDATGQKNPTFTLEAPAFMNMFLPVSGVCPSSTTNVYRVFDNRTDANHRYTTDRSIRDGMVGKGWVAEGDGPDRVVMCAPQ